MMATLMSSQQWLDFLTGATTVLNVGRDTNTRNVISAITLVISVDNYTSTRTKTGNIVLHVTVNFLNQECFDLHYRKTEKGKSTCEAYYRCNQCSQLINRSKHKRDHVCGETYCKTCKEYVNEDHQCYMQSAYVDQDNNDKKKPIDTQYMFFDFECTQDSIVECDDGYLPGKDNLKC